MLDGEARLVDPFLRRLIHIPRVCRQIRKSVTPILRQNTNLKTVTFKYNLLFDNWFIAIHSDESWYKSFLGSVPDS